MKIAEGLPRLGQHRVVDLELRLEELAPQLGLLLRRFGAGGAEYVDHPIHDLSRPTRIAGGVRHIHDVGAGAGRDAHAQDQATDRGITARHAQQALAHTGPLRDREPNVTGTPYATRCSPSGRTTVRLSRPKASGNESGSAVAATPTSVNRLAGNLRVAMRSIGVLSTTSPATVRLVSSSICDRRGSTDAPPTVRVGPSTRPPVRARRESAERITATARYTGCER